MSGLWFFVLQFIGRKLFKTLSSKSILHCDQKGEILAWEVSKNTHYASYTFIFVLETLFRGPEAA